MGRAAVGISELSREVGNAIARLRTSMGLTLEDVAAGTTLGASVMSAMERGKRKVTMNDIEQLAGFYNVEPSAFMPTRSGEPLGGFRLPEMSADQRLLLDALSLDDTETLFQAVGIITQNKSDREARRAADQVLKLGTRRPAGYELEEESVVIPVSKLGD